MFANDGGEIVGVPGEKAGVLYTVSFMPGNVEIPIEIKWRAPDRTIYSRPDNVKYMQQRVAILELPRNGIYGKWAVEFYFNGNKIGEQQMNVVAPMRHRS